MRNRGFLRGSSTAARQLASLAGSLRLRSLRLRHTRERLRSRGRRFAPWRERNSLSDQCKAGRDEVTEEMLVWRRARTSEGMEIFSEKKKFFQNETRSTVSICLPLAITVDKKYEVPLDESDRETACFYVEALLRLAGSLRSPARRTSALVR